MKNLVFSRLEQIDIRGEFNIELWPGYITSIRQHETDLLICSEIAHKVMRKDTIYDNMQRIHREERDFQSKFLTAVLGQTVLTEFNNRTYRIDDVDYASSPKSEFLSKTGPITFLEYYQKRYNITIRDVNQPLLVVKSKARDIRGGESETIRLIPELCRSTGLTETMRSNFRQVQIFLFSKFRFALGANFMLCRTVFSPLQFYEIYGSVHSNESTGTHPKITGLQQKIEFMQRER